MACPRCAGANRTPLAANYWHCTANVIYHETVMQPAPVGPATYIPIDPLLLMAWCDYPSTLEKATGTGPIDPFFIAHSDASILNMLRNDLTTGDFDVLVASGLHTNSSVIRIVAQDVHNQRQRRSVELIPITITRERVCGHNYQDGPPTDTSLSCDCGYFAIGRCKECARPVCGVHSTLLADRLLCQDHLLAAEAAATEAAATAANAKAQREAQEAAAREERERTVTTMSETIRTCVRLTCTRKGQKDTSLRCPECGMPTEPA
jgi:hypothetical protein